MINPVVDAILSRRSVRAYTEEPVRDEDLKILLDCALFAPNGGGLQNPRYLVIRRPELLEELNRAIREELSKREPVPGEMMARGILRARTEGYHFIHHAPVLITAVAPAGHSNAMADCVCGLENIQLAAWSLGLGSCYSNQPHWLTDVPEIRAIFARVGLREGEEICGSVSVGHILHRAKRAAARRPGRVVLDVPRELGGGEEDAGSRHSISGQQLGGE